MNIKKKIRKVKLEKKIFRHEKKKLEGKNVFKIRKDKYGNFIVQCFWWEFTHYWRNGKNSIIATGKQNGIELFVHAGWDDYPYVEAGLDGCQRFKNPEKAKRAIDEIINAKAIRRMTKIMRHYRTQKKINNVYGPNYEEWYP